MRPLSHSRQWEVPHRRPFLRMNWHDLLFMHWPIPGVDIQRLLPEGLTVDTFDGYAWIGVVPFRMSDVAPLWSPAVPGLSNFPELNVRTYVHCGSEGSVDSKPGVWFFSLDATQWLAVRVARWMYNLNYVDAAISLKSTSDNFIEYRSRRKQNWPAAEYSARYRSTGEGIKNPNDLELWLTSRYCMYAADPNGNLYRGEIDHQPWQLERAECEVCVNTMTEWLGIHLPPQNPLLHFSRAISVRAWSMERVKN